MAYQQIVSGRDVEVAEAYASSFIETEFRCTGKRRDRPYRPRWCQAQPALETV